MEVKFIAKKIKNTPEATKIIKMFNDAFRQFHSQLPQFSEASVVQAPAVAKDNPEKSVLTKTIHSFFPNAIITYLDESNEEYLIPAEAFEYKSSAHEYYLKFKRELRNAFILSSKISECTQYDESNSDFPQKPIKAGILLLIEELINRIVARVLSQQAEGYAKRFIDIVFKSFIESINSADTNFKINAGLVISGKQMLMKDTDNKISPSGTYLLKINDEITYLDIFFSSSEALNAFNIGINLGFNACFEEGNRVKQRIIMALQYLLKPNLGKLPQNILNETSLNDTIQKLVAGLTEEYSIQINENSTLIPLQDGTSICSELLLVNNAISQLKSSSKLKHKKAPSLIAMIEQNLKFETQRIILGALFDGLEKCHRMLGHLLIVSGSLDIQSIHGAIQKYKLQTAEIQKYTPDFLTEIDITRGKIWTKTNNQWDEILHSLQNLGRPMVQERLIKHAAAGMKILFDVDKSLLQAQLLKNGESIFNQDCLQKLVQGLGVSISGNVPLLELAQEKGWINSSVTNQAVTCPNTPSLTDFAQVNSCLPSENFNDIYALQELFAERILPENLMTDEYVDLIGNCNLKINIGPNVQNSNIFRHQVYQVALKNYDFRAKWSPKEAWWSLGISHARWTNYDLYKLRFFYSKFAQAFKIITKVKLSDDESIKKQQEAMIDSLMAAFLQKMSKELDYHKEAKYLLAETNNGKYGTINPNLAPLIQEVSSTREERTVKYILSPKFSALQQNADLTQKLEEINQKYNDMSDTLQERTQENGALSHTLQERTQENGELKQENGELKQENGELQQENGELKQEYRELQQKHGELQQENEEKDQIIKRMNTLLQINSQNNQCENESLLKRIKELETALTANLTKGQSPLLARSIYAQKSSMHSSPDTTLTQQPH